MTASQPEPYDPSPDSDFEPRDEMAIWGLVLANLRDDRDTEARLIHRLAAHGVWPFEAFHAAMTRLNGALIQAVEDWPDTVATMINHFGVDTSDLDALDTTEEEL